MVSGIKAGTFENDTDGGVNLTQSFFVAFWAAGENGVVKTLHSLKADSTVFATVSVDWHRRPHRLVGIYHQPVSIIARVK